MCITRWRDYFEDYSHFNFDTAAYLVNFAKNIGCNYSSSTNYLNQLVKCGRSKTLEQTIILAPEFMLRIESDGCCLTRPS